MICVLPCCLNDASDMVRLLKWIALLGPCKNHDALIVTDASVPALKVLELKALADGIFKEVRLITNERPVSGWPNGCNSLFHAAAKYIYTAQEKSEFPEPWLWLEPDAIPLKSGWLDAIETEQQNHERGEAYWAHFYMGHIYANSDPKFPKQIMSGVAVYPWDAYKDFEDRILLSPLAWDVDLAKVMVENGVHTPLIHHVWGEYGNPPVFSETGVLGTNVFCPEQIPKEAVIWHRNKDHSLLRILKRRMFPNEKPEIKIDVVFPVCMQDVNMATYHAHWLIKMGRRYDRRAVIAFDPTCNLVAIQQFQRLLEQVFSKVDLFKYPTPRVIAWPHAPNWAFQHTAYYMSHQDNPWLWLEADAVVLKPEWLEALEFRYEKAGKPFVGAKVKGMSHYQGTMIYPPDTPSRIPSAFKAFEHAWDYLCGPEMDPQAHDASDLCGHIWSTFGDEASEVGGGQVPDNVTVERARKWIKPTNVFIHRIKDVSLINLLMKEQYP